MKTILARTLLLTLTILTIGCAASPPAPPDYHLVAEYRIGGEGRWDFFTIDPQTKRLYIPRSDRVIVVNADNGATIGEIPNTKGVHGVALAPNFNRGFTSNGSDGSLTVFDLKTLSTLGKVKAGNNPDAIMFDPASARIFAFNGRSKDATIIDASADPTNAQTQKLDLGGKPESAVADGNGQVFVNIEDTAELVRIDSKSLKVTARWPIAPGANPTGLAIDAKHRRLFISCRNQQMVIMNADTGAVITTLPIGEGVDACEFDPQTHLAFASNRDGTLTVIHEDSLDKFRVVQNVVTKKGAKTMALDPITHRVYLVTADFAPTSAPTTTQSRPRQEILPGTFTILVVDR